ncbi:MAG: 4Fe-4S binding protein [Deltaproteobacteria bacterium]|nr:4Fe-4S binding protein [Deltaproteobacteria bacterium]
MMFVWLRRAYQVVFFGLFLFLVFATSASLIGGYPVEWFLGLDPLVALSTGLATHSLYNKLVWALPLIILTMIFGRFFCGWMCPMGVLHHSLSWLVRKKKVQERAKANLPTPAQNIKYVILAVMLAMAAMGSVQVGWLDPIASTWRGLSVSLVPAASNLAFGVYQGERHFQFGTWVAIFFFGALALNLVRPRFYCRVLCPLGALLGLFSKFALFRIHRVESVCSSCNKCGADCAGAADPEGTLRVTECMLCLNCTVSCPNSGMGYRFMPRSGPATTQIDLSRRRWVGAAVGGLLAVPVARASTGVDPRPNPLRIRPPGSLDEPEFLERCIKCAACMKVCPTSGLQPALRETGIEGLWSPVLVPKLGYCEHSCVLCGQVCPTGAILPLTVAIKTGQGPSGQPVRIGSAAFDKGRCLPWAYDTECIVCEEVCPTSPKAIYFKLETVTVRDGSTLTLRRPFVDLTRCTGCGVCEARCPVFDTAAVRVSSVGETRSPTNRIIMSGGEV